MKESIQVPIRYREFHDLPRAIVVEFERGVYFLDCKFDADIDDYSQFFDVFKLTGVEMGELDGLDWSSLSERGEQIGKVAVAKVVFDKSKRKHIDSSELKKVIAGQS